MVDPLHAGDLLTVILQEETSQIMPNPELFVPVIYEDEDFILFDKPPFMPVHPSIAHHHDTLANYFAYYMEQKGIPSVFRPINRLDANTTGLCLAAKNAFLRQTAVRKFAEGIYRCPDGGVSTRFWRDRCPDCQNAGKHHQADGGS